MRVLKYKELEFEVNEVTTNYNNSWFNFYNAFQQYTSYSSTYIQPILEYLIYCNSKEPLSVLEEALNNKDLNSKAVLIISEGKFEINDLKLSHIETSYNFRGELESTICFSYSNSQFFPPSKLGFFKS